MASSYQQFTYDHYEQIIKSALEHGYRFASFTDAAALRAAGQSFCILRHDCDYDLAAALDLARREVSLGVRSTYFLMLRSSAYNLLSIPAINIVREIIRAGHWIGLHFDPEAYLDAPLEQIPHDVDVEREWLSREFGLPIDVVSFHIPTRPVLDNQIKLNCLNTYDREDMKDVYYLSDSTCRWREGDPVGFFQERRKPRLQLLLHPEWWTQEEMALPEKWDRILRSSLELMQASLLEREPSYHRRAVTFLKTAKEDE